MKGIGNFGVSFKNGHSLGLHVLVVDEHEICFHVTSNMGDLLNFSRGFDSTTILCGFRMAAFCYTFYLTRRLDADLTPITPCAVWIATSRQVLRVFSGIFSVSTV